MSIVETVQESTVEGCLLSGIPLYMHIMYYVVHVHGQCTVDVEIFVQRNFCMINFRVKIFS